MNSNATQPDSDPAPAKRPLFRILTGVAIGILAIGLAIVLFNVFRHRYYSNPSEPRSSRLTFDGRWPSVQFDFQYTKNADIKFLQFSFFDARTHTWLTRSAWWSALGDDRMQVTANLNRWHDGPVEIVMDVRHGPIESIDIPIRQGKVIRYDNWLMQLAAVRPDHGRKDKTAHSSSTPPND